jgi:hypothetical protein
MTEWDCDVEMLESEDVPDVPGASNSPAAMYASQMAKLSTICSFPDLSAILPIFQLWY